MVNLLRLYGLERFYDSQLFSLNVSTPVVQLELKLFREYLPCKYGDPWSHSLFALTAVRIDLLEWFLAVLFCVITLTVSAGWSQFLGFSATSIWYFWLFLPLVMLYSVTTSSALMLMGVRPVRMQSASWDIVRCAWAILKLISLCTLIYLALLHSFLMNSIHTGAAYSSCDSIAQFYIVLSASCSSLQLILADLDKAFIRLVLL